MPGLVGPGREQDPPVRDQQEQDPPVRDQQEQDPPVREPPVREPRRQHQLLTCPALLNHLKPLHFDQHHLRLVELVRRCTFLEKQLEKQCLVFR